MNTTPRTPGCPVRIMFDHGKAREWMFADENGDTDPVETILADEEWGHTGDLSDNVTLDLSNLLAAFPDTVLNGPEPQIYALADDEEFQTLITVGLANFVKISDTSVTELRHLLPGDGDIPDGGEYPQVARALFAIQQIVDVANRLVEGLYNTLDRVADGRGEYLDNLAPTQSGDFIKTEVATLRSAAAIIVGDDRPLFGLLPSWRYTDRMRESLGPVNDL